MSMADWPMVDLGPKDPPLTNLLIYNTFFTYDTQILMHSSHKSSEI